MKTSQQTDANSDIEKMQGQNDGSPVNQEANSESNDSFRYGLIILVLLLLAVLGIYAPKMLSSISQADAVIATEGYSYVSDLDFWRRTNREVHVATSIAFDLGSDLNQVPLTIGKWLGQDMPDTNQEVEILLDPEQYVRRLYQHENGQYMWLSLIGGRSSQPFHAPDICYEADGWQYDVGSHPFALSNNGEIYGLWLNAEKQTDPDAARVEHFVSYFYIFPDQERDLADGIVLFKLTSARIGTVEENLSVHEDFVSSVFDGIQYQE